MSIAREIVCEAKRRGDIIGLPSLSSIDEDILESLIAAKLKERDEKIRRVILAGTKVTCRECCGRGWFGDPITGKKPCLTCDGSGKVLSEEAEEALALLEGGDDEIQQT